MLHFTTSEILRVSTVRTPVTRRPPYRSRRAVFPHRVPQLYSLPRCKTKASCKRPQTSGLGDTGHCDGDAGKDTLKLRPGVTPPPTPPVEPFECTGHGPLEEGPVGCAEVRSASVASDAVPFVHRILRGLTHSPYTVTHRVHRPMLWVCGRPPCCPHTHSPVIYSS